MGDYGKIMKGGELVNAIRKDLEDELSAQAQYQKHIDGTNDPHVKEMLTDIMHEEITHAGQLQMLLQYLDKGEAQYLYAGGKEGKDDLGDKIVRQIKKWKAEMKKEEDKDGDWD